MAALDGRSRWSKSLIYAWLILILNSGCSEPTARVRGVVTLPGASPAVGVTVVLEDKPNKVRAAGTSDEHGAFVLPTAGSPQRLPPGDYVVTVHPAYSEDSSAP